MAPPLKPHDLLVLYLDPVTGEPVSAPPIFTSLEAAAQYAGRLVGARVTRMAFVVRYEATILWENDPVLDGVDDRTKSAPFDPGEAPVMKKAPAPGVDPFPPFARN